MNYQLLDLFDALHSAHTTEAAGQTFVTWSQDRGANVVHTFFGPEIAQQHISTLPGWFVELNCDSIKEDKPHFVNDVTRGVPRVFWGVDLDEDDPRANAKGRELSRGRYDHFQQRASVTFAMPDPSRNYSGGGIGIGFDERKDPFLRNMEDAGGVWLCAAHAAYAALTRLDQKKRPSPLSHRQTEILLLLCEGMKLGEIAEKLCLSDSAINLYLSNLRRKLGVRTKEQALAMALREGWISP